MARLPFGARRRIAAVVRRRVSVRCPPPRGRSSPTRASSPTPSSSRRSRSIRRRGRPTRRSRPRCAPRSKRRSRGSAPSRHARRPEVKVGTLLRAYQRARPPPSRRRPRVQAMRRRLPILGVEPDGTVHARIHLAAAAPRTKLRSARSACASRASATIAASIYARSPPADIDRVAAQAAVARTRRSSAPRSTPARCSRKASPRSWSTGSRTQLQRHRQEGAASA